ncbi:hypothetical protein GCM10027605_26540 [Micromonospora zhanjiangensis]
MSKPTPISGFPEWLPPQRMIEQYVLDRIRTTFELYGFAPLETRAVEPLDQLLRKGRPPRRSTCCAGCRRRPVDRPATAVWVCTST